jgi:hypothetical protein
MAKRDFRKGGIPYEFAPIPKDVLNMPEFQALPSSAKALMLDLMGQYTGKNNGRLCPAFEVMQRAGWVSKGTLQRAREALLEAPFAVLTRKGHPPRTVDWIGFTWWKLDYDKSMDGHIDPRSFPYLNFIKMVMADPNTGRELAKKQILSPRNEGVRTRKVILRPPEIGAMKGLQ